MVSADRDASQEFVINMEKPNTKNKNALVVKNPEKYRLPILGRSSII